MGCKKLTYSDFDTTLKVVYGDFFESKKLGLNYYPFGMEMAGRSGSANSEGSKFGFNGKGKDNEISGEGNSYDFGARLYNPRLGRWLSRDAHESKYPAISTYSFVANNPLIYVDPDGKDIKVASEVVDGKTIITVTVTGKLINESSTAYTQEQLQAYTDRLVASIVSSYTGSDGDVSWKGVANITVATENNQLSATDHAFRIVDKDKIPVKAGGFEEEGTLGKAPLGQNVVYLSQHMLDRTQAVEGEYAGTGKTSSGKGTLERTGPHEIGHSAYIKESNEGDGTHPTPGTMDGNLMHQTMQPNAGTKLTKDQILEIKKRFDGGELNKGEQKIQ